MTTPTPAAALVPVVEAFDRSGHSPLADGRACLFELTLRDGAAGGVAQGCWQVPGCLRQVTEPRRAVPRGSVAQHRRR